MSNRLKDTYRAKYLTWFWIWAAFCAALWLLVMVEAVPPAPVVAWSAMMACVWFLFRPRNMAKKIIKEAKNGAALMRAVNAEINRQEQQRRR